MARNYTVAQTDTNTAATTQATIAGTTAVRPMLNEVIISSVATPADNAAEYFIQRHTGDGSGTAWTPVAVDSGDPASSTTAKYNHSIEPTYTSNIIVLRFAANQRATFRWIANPGKEIKCPASTNGLGLLANAVGGSAYTNAFTLIFEE